MKSAAVSSADKWGTLDESRLVASRLIRDYSFLCFTPHINICTTQTQAHVTVNITLEVVHWNQLPLKRNFTRPQTENFLLYRHHRYGDLDHRGAVHRCLIEFRSGFVVRGSQACLTRRVGAHSSTARWTVCGDLFVRMVFNGTSAHKG
jgi:hypothetical protein